MEMIFPRKVTVKIYDTDGNVVEQDTVTTWLSRAQFADRVREGIEELVNEDETVKIGKVEII